MNDKDLKQLMDLLSDLGICQKSNNISDEIDCEYDFGDSDGILRTSKLTYENLPDNWGIDYYRDEEENEGHKDFVRYFTSQITKVKDRSSNG